MVKENNTQLPQKSRTKVSEVPLKASSKKDTIPRKKNQICDKLPKQSVNHSKTLNGCNKSNGPTLRQRLPVMTIQGTKITLNMVSPQRLSSQKKAVETPPKSRNTSRSKSSKSKKPQMKKSAILSLNLKQIFEDSPLNNSIDKRGKIDFPGQSPLSSVNCSQIGEAIYTQRLRSVNSRVGSHKNSRKSASDQRKISAVNSIREKSLSSKNQRSDKRSISNKQEGRNLSAASLRVPTSDLLKKREIKEIDKMNFKADPDITSCNIINERRRSSRIEKQDEKDPIRSKYTVDKLRYNEYRNQVFDQDRIEQDEILLQKVKEASLTMETKHKVKKDLIRQSEKFFKNFINENSEYFDEGIMQKDSQPIPKKSQQIKIKTPEKPYINTSGSEFMPSSGEKSQLSQTKVDPEKKEECLNELQDLLGVETNEDKKQKKDDFLEPLPVKKQKTAAQTPSKTYNPEDVLNPMDTEIRKHFTTAFKFVDFAKQDTENALYKPAMIQKVQNASPIQIEPQTSAISIANTAASSEIQSQISISSHNFKDVSKGHFIKRKQSQCNVKRVCGVSYVKKTESKQEKVRERGYEKLPPIVIQGSYTLPKNLNMDEVFKMEEQVQGVINQLLLEGSENTILVVTAFESINEIDMKQYLLKPHKRSTIAQGRYWLINKPKDCNSILDQLWVFIKDKFFVCIHLAYDSEQLVKGFQVKEGETLENQIQEFVLKSDICIGLLPKRGNASVKSMLKAYKLEENYDKHMNNQKPESNQGFNLQKLINCEDAFISGINTIAYLSRLEMYVSENQWQQASMKLKQTLTTFIYLLEENICSVLLKWNMYRTQIYHKYEPQNHIKKVVIKKELQEKQINVAKWEDLKDDFVHKPESNEGILKMEWVSQNDPIEVMPHLRKNLPVPVTLINTRDCFAYDLKCTENIMNLGKGREKVIKKEYHFDPEILNAYPANFKQVMGLNNNADMSKVDNLKVGVTCYENFYSPQELDEMEKNIMETEKISLKDGFLPMTAQKTFTGTNLKRTKFFFGYRYMWTRTQLQDPLANVAAGVRADVSQPPIWMKDSVEDPLVQAGLVEKDFINSVALNVYHDGSEGLAQHFDDATRFKQPIYTLRMFSDSRLSFGSQYYGFQNGAYYIPLPRGCICIMEEESYSANGVKHCVRPCDMTGKSSAVILRQMHPNVIQEATKLDRNIDLPMWMSSLSLEDKAIPYYQQREMECQWLERNIEGACPNKSVSVQKSLKQFKKPSLLEKRPFRIIQTDIPDQDKKHVFQLMEDIVSRVETKAIQEEQITRKINDMRQKLRSANPGQISDKLEVVGLFKTEIMKK